MIHFFDRRLLWWSSAALFVLAFLSWFFLLRGGNGHHSAEWSAGHHDEDTSDLMTLKAVKPKRNKAELIQSVTQPAYVQAFHRAELMTRVAGLVKAVYKNIGDTVKKGEPLIELDVPDLEQDLAHREAMVQLTEQEVRAAEAALAGARAAEKATAALVREKQADLQRDQAKRKFAQSAYNRVRRLADSNAVEAALVDEKLRNLEAADADIKSATTAVESARANLEQGAAKVLAAEVDVQVKKKRVAVAEAERGKAKALVGYATIKAPFDGMVVSRLVDPGDFVQNASSGGQPLALMTVLRNDIVTLVMWVPEREAPLVSKDTEAIVKLDALRRREVRARISRMSQWLDPDKSRDMRVEVDLPNKDGRLKVGMYGSMQLILRRFNDAPLLPASAVFVRNGRTHICELQDDHKAHLVPVRVVLEDGIRVSVVKMVPKHDPTLKTEIEEAVDLTGEEVIVRSGQGEIQEGQEVKATVEEW